MCANKINIINFDFTQTLISFVVGTCLKRESRHAPQTHSWDDYSLVYDSVMSWRKHGFMFFSLQRTGRVNCGCVQTERPALRDYSASPPGVLQTDNDEVLRGSSDEGSSAISAHLYLVSLIAIQTITESMQMNSIFQLIDNSEEKSRQPQRSHCLVSYLIKRNMLFCHLWKNISINQIQRSDKCVPCLLWWFAYNFTVWYKFGSRHHQQDSSL